MTDLNGTLGSHKEHGKGKNNEKINGLWKVHKRKILQILLNEFVIHRK